MAPSIPETLDYKIEQLVRDQVLSTSDIPAEKAVCGQRGQYYDASGQATGDEVKAPEPDIPYVLVHFNGQMQQTGLANERQDEDHKYYKTPYRAVVALRGVGRPTMNWLTRLHMLTEYRQAIVKAPNPPSPMSVQSNSEIHEFQVQMDVEARFFAEIKVDKENEFIDTVDLNTTTQ